MATYTAVITNDGRNLFAAAASGGGQVFPVRVDTGDGTLGATDATTLSHLIHLVQSYAISSSNALVPYQATFQFLIDSSLVTSTYQLREIGLIGKLGSGGAETLIYYSSTAGTPDTITPSSGDSAVIDFNSLTIAFSNTPNTVATLTAAVPPALHAITHLHRTDGSSPDPIPTANNSDFGLCPATPNDPSTVLVGSSTAAFGPVPPHAVRHIGTGPDPLPLSTSAASGALRALSGDATQVLNGTGNWGAGFFPGFVTDYAGAVAPAGWLLCDGSAVSRTTYSALFAAIGVLHGPGDGSTTFNLPDCRGRVSVGAGNGPGLTARGMGAKGGEETHLLSVAEMPIHKHVVNDPQHSHPIYDPTHAHSLADPGHAHSLAQNPHSHTVYHFARQEAAGGTNTWVGYGYPQSGPAQWTSFCSSVTIGIGVYAAATGLGVYGAATGIATYGAATGISLANAGSSVPHNNLQPFVVLNKIVKF